MGRESGGTHGVVLDGGTKFGQQAPRLFDKRTEVTALAERIEIPQAVQLGNLANLCLGRFEVTHLFVLVVIVLVRRRSGGSVVEVFEEEGHELREAVFEEFGQVLRVEVVVQLEQEQEGTVEDGRLLGGESGPGRQDRVGLLLAFPSGISACFCTRHGPVQSRPHTWKILRYGSQNRSKTNLISRKRVSVRNSARHLNSCQSQPGFRAPPIVSPSPPEDRVSGLEDGVVDDEVVGGELGGQLLQRRARGQSNIGVGHLPRREAHLDEVVPLVGEVGLCHDGDRFSNLDLERWFARERDHDGDDRLLERLGSLRRQRRRRIFELCRARLVRVAPKATQDVYLTPPTGVGRR